MNLVGMGIQTGGILCHQNLFLGNMVFIAFEYKP